jgi:DNA integrity scanning protein DisA with diadenylate cyclase activity
VFLLLEFVSQVLALHKAFVVPAFNALKINNYLDCSFASLQKGSGIGRRHAKKVRSSLERRRNRYSPDADAMAYSI